MNTKINIRYIPNILELSLIFILAWLVSSWWSLAIMDEPARLSVKPVDSLLTRSMDVKDIVKVRLFGKENIQPTVKKTKIKPVLVSRLNIKLLGTVVAGKRSAAVITVGTSAEKTFFLGDSLQAGVFLKTVEVDAVVVDHQGKLERISLLKGKSLPGASIAMARPHAPTIHHPLSRTVLNRATQNFPKLLSQARVAPYLKQGRANGFVISEIVPNSLYAQIGLKNGDVIRKVNGQSVTNAEQAMKMYQTLQSASVIDLELQRNGEVLPIHYTIK